MLLPAYTLRSFLNSAKSALRSTITSQQRITLVVGNESADLDSITSAIVYAFLKSTAVGVTPVANQPVNRSGTPAQTPPLYIPLVNIAAKDVSIRPELLALLKHVDVEPDGLITLDDLEIPALKGTNPTGSNIIQPQFAKLVLTDHNKLTGLLAKQGFSDSIDGCIDHHVDEKGVPQDVEMRLITKAGSCTSLVVQQCRETWEALERNEGDAKLAKFALASVLIDTGGLMDADKTESVDCAAADFLESRIGSGWDRSAFLAEIQSAKGSVDKFSVNDILRKDYKEWDEDGRKVGIAVVVKPLEWMVHKANGALGFKKELRHFVEGKGLLMLAVMTASTDQNGQFRRELLLWGVGSEASPITDAFGQEMKGELGLVESRKLAEFEKEDDGTRMKIWCQQKVEYSRKKVAPMLRKAIRT